MSKAANVHRFRDHVALFVGTGETIHISPKEAREFARALIRAALDCEYRSFTESTFSGQDFEFAPLKIDRR